MGIKHLWTVLQPYCERKPLYELQGKTVAVDLSCWICEAQNIAEYQVQPRMYLRNLYFRTCYLLLMEVNPVFVLEGQAPQLKYDTITARNAIQFKGAKPKTDKTKTNKGRTRFNFVLKQCEEMLGLLGLACVKGNGEAESLCAYLNDEGLVDGCISQDSDCFAYGAKVVYRNFSISTQGAHTASGGAVDIYDINKVINSMNFGRNKIIAMALMVGCDYNDGIQGVGKESVLKLFETIDDKDILDKIRTWRSDNQFYDKYEKIISDKNICSSCGHSGKIQSHTRKGCPSCNTRQGCDSSLFKEKRITIKNELNVRHRALQDPNFPDEDLINEFLVKKDSVLKLDVKWKQPDMVKFIKFTTKYLQWEELYAFEKILPILTRWQCVNFNLLQNRVKTKAVLYPDRIKKVRNPKGLPSYQIIWKDTGDYCKGLIPEEQLTENDMDLEKLWSTIEPQHLIDNAYPDLVEAFKQSKIKPKKPSKRKKKENTSMNEAPKEKKTRKPRKKKAETGDIISDINNSLSELAISNSKTTKTTLDNFLIKKAMINSHIHKNLVSQELEGLIQSSTPTKNRDIIDVSFPLDVSKFGDEDDTLDLSDIIDEIVSREPPKYNLFNNNKGKTQNEELNTSSFFITNPSEEKDLFEKTFDEQVCVICSSSDEDDNSGDETEEYEVDKKCVDIEMDDSFIISDIPLLQRLKR